VAVVVTRFFCRTAFFIAVQTFFTLCFILMLIGIVGVLMYVLCFTHEHQVRLLRAISIDLLLAGNQSTFHSRPLSSAGSADALSAGEACCELGQDSIQYRSGLERFPNNRVSLPRLQASAAL